MALHLGAARRGSLPNHRCARPDQSVGWIPLCPPSGRHAYHFRVYALDTLLTGLEAPTRAQLEAAMQGHILATGQIVGTYERVQIQ